MLVWLTLIGAFCGEPEAGANDSAVRTVVEERDRNDDGKTDQRLTRVLRDNVTVLTVVEVYDTENGELELRTQLIYWAGKLVVSEFDFGDSRTFFVERDSGAGLGLTSNKDGRTDQIAVFDKKRELVDAFRRAADGNFHPLSRDELSEAQDTISGFVGLSQSVLGDGQAETDEAD